MPQKEPRRNRSLRRRPPRRIQLQAPHLRRHPPAHWVRVDALSRRYSPPSPIPHSTHILITLPSHRSIHQPRPLLLHLPHKPRSSAPNHRIRRRSLQRQRHPHQPPLHQRMHHQHNLRALHRSRQRLLHQRPLRHLRMVTLRANPRAILSRQTFASERSSLFHRGEVVKSSRI